MSSCMSNHPNPLIYTTLIILKFTGYKMHHFNYKSVENKGLPGYGTLQTLCGLLFPCMWAVMGPAPTAEAPKKQNIKELTQTVITVIIGSVLIRK